MTVALIGFAFGVGFVLPDFVRRVAQDLVRQAGVEYGRDGE